jgi:hypothetical protein
METEPVSHGAGGQHTRSIEAPLGRTSAAGASIGGGVCIPWPTWKSVISCISRLRRPQATSRMPPNLLESTHPPSVAEWGGSRMSLVSHYSNVGTCAFRGRRPLIPIHSGHPFRMKPAGDSDEVGQGGGSDREPMNGVSLRRPRQAWRSSRRAVFAGTRLSAQACVRCGRGGRAPRRQWWDRRCEHASCRLAVGW